MRDLTSRQREVLDAINAYTRRHGFPPSRTELAHNLGLSEASSVTGHLARLADAGYIEVLPNTNRGIRVLGQNVPLIGPIAEVAAGTPIVCEAHILERVPGSIADQFHPKPDYLLTVRGDSLELTGITDGSIVCLSVSLSYFLSVTYGRCFPVVRRRVTHPVSLGMETSANTALHSSAGSHSSA